MHNVSFTKPQLLAYNFVEPETSPSAEKTVPTSGDATPTSVRTRLVTSLRARLEKQRLSPADIAQSTPSEDILKTRQFRPLEKTESGRISRFKWFSHPAGTVLPPTTSTIHSPPDIPNFNLLTSAGILSQTESDPSFPQEQLLENPFASPMANDPVTTETPNAVDEPLDISADNFIASSTSNTFYDPTAYINEHFWQEDDEGPTFPGEQHPLNTEQPNSDHEPLDASTDNFIAALAKNTFFDPEALIGEQSPPKGDHEEADFWGQAQYWSTLADMATNTDEQIEQKDDDEWTFALAQGVDDAFTKNMAACEATDDSPRFLNMSNSWLPFTTAEAQPVDLGSAPNKSSRTPTRLKALSKDQLAALDEYIHNEEFRCDDLKKAFPGVKYGILMRLAGERRKKLQVPLKRKKVIKSNRQIPWTLEITEALDSYINDKITRQELVSKLARTRDTVNKWITIRCEQLGKPNKVRTRAYFKRKSSHKGNQRTTWTPDQVAVLDLYIDKKLSRDEVIARLGKAGGTLHRWLTLRKAQRGITS